MTLSNHIEAIREHVPKLIESYRLIASTIASSARRAGHIDKEAEYLLKEVLYEEDKIDFLHS